MKKLDCVCAIVLAAMLVSCQSGGQAPHVDLQADATYDGLYPVRNARVDRLLAKPELNLSAYSKVRLAAVSFEYKVHWGEYRPSDQEENRIRTEMHDVLRDELGISGIEVSELTGSDTLDVEIRVIDLHLNLSEADRNEIAAASPDAIMDQRLSTPSSDITVIGEIRDSLSGEIFLRFSDMAAGASLPFDASEAYVWTDFRIIFRKWSLILREGIEGIAGVTDFQS